MRSDFGEEMVSYLVWQWYFHIYTNCTICGVSLLPERRFKVHDALFMWCLEGCN